MKYIIKPVIIAAVLGLSLLLCISTFILPETLPSSAPSDVFSSGRAMAHVEKIADSIHPAGTAEHDAVRDYLINELTNLGLKPEVQKTFSSYEIWGETISGDVENIYAVLPGTEKTGQAILMCAHYDSTSGGPGAMDDASGVAVILETIRALNNSARLKNDMIFLITDREEDGLLGAAAFAMQSPLLKDVSLVLNFEARGNAGPALMFETGEMNGWFMNEFKKTVPYPVSYSFAYDVYKNMPNNTDFTIFKMAGKNGFNFAPVLGYETYHTMYDTPENLDQNTLQHEGAYALSLVKHFGNLSLSGREESNAVYFTLANSVMVLYSDSLALPFALAGIILFIAAFIIGLRKKFISAGKTLLGLLLSLLSIITSAVIGFAGVTIFSGTYLNHRSMLSREEYMDIFKNSGTWMLAMVLLSFLILFMITRLFKKKVSYQNQLFGSLLLWAILAVVSGIMFKGASYLFLWPFILTTLGLLALLLLKPGRGQNNRYLAVFILSAVSCILIFLPAAYLLFQCMTIMMAEAVTVISIIPAGIMLLSIMLYVSKHEEVVRNAGISETN